MQLPVCYNPNITKWPNIGTVFWATVKGGRSVVQRLLQLARELVMFEYKTGLRVKEMLLPGDLGKNKLSYSCDIEVSL